MRNGFAPLKGQFQSRYRAASHFRRFHFFPPGTVPIGFNLVIERLLISGQQVVRANSPPESFNLVIERLLISGQHSVLFARGSI